MNVDGSVVKATRLDVYPRVALRAAVFLQGFFIDLIWKIKCTKYTGNVLITNQRYSFKRSLLLQLPLLML